MDIGYSQKPRDSVYAVDPLQLRPGAILVMIVLVGESKLWCRAEFHRVFSRGGRLAGSEQQALCFQMLQCLLNIFQRRLWQTVCLLHQIRDLLPRVLPRAELEDQDGRGIEKVYSILLEVVNYTSVIRRVDVEIADMLRIGGPIAPSLRFPPLSVIGVKWLHV